MARENELRAKYHGAKSPTGYGPASFLLGMPNSYAPWIGNIGADQTVIWYGVYAQDRWQLTRKVVTAGICRDYVTPPNYHKIVSGLDVLTGQFILSGAVPPYYPTASGSSGHFLPQYNGWEPRFGVVYSATDKTVVHAAFAMLVDHNNTLVQENQYVRLTWPSRIAANFTSLDLAVSTMSFGNLPTASSLLRTSRRTKVMVPTPTTRSRSRCSFHQTPAT
jgi:hypothetical protein